MFRVLLVVAFDIVPGGLLRSVALVGKAGVNQLLYLGLVSCEGIKPFTIHSVVPNVFILSLLQQALALNNKYEVKNKI